MIAIKSIKLDVIYYQIYPIQKIVEIFINSNLNN